MAAGDDRPDPAPQLAPTRFRPGQSGNPGGRPKWRTQLEKLVGNGQELFEVAYDLARARVVIVRDVGGRPYKESVSIRDRGRKSGYRREKQILKIVPTATIVLQAQQMLLDRAFGRPKEVLELEPGPGAQSAALLADLDAADLQLLREIAHRRLLRAGRPPEAIPETIDVPPDPNDLGARSDPGAAPGASEEV